MSTIFFEVSKTEEGVISGLFDAPGIKFSPGKLDIEKAKENADAEIVSVFIDSLITKECIDAMPSLRHIATRSTGFDHIDVAYAKTKGISVSNVPAYGARTVAEFTFALILALARKIFPARLQLLAGDNFSISSLRGFDLNEKTLGVVGTGKIGKNVIKIAHGFDMKVVAFDLYPDNDFAKENSFSYVSLDEVLEVSDIVTLHVPYTPDNKHLINKENIFSTKAGAYLINTARGELVDTEALVSALTKGHLAGAGLDVLESERQLKEELELLRAGSEALKDFKTLFENHVLLDLPQVLVTPHIAFFTKEAQEEILRTTVSNIKRFEMGQAINLL